MPSAQRPHTTSCPSRREPPPCEPASHSGIPPRPAADTGARMDPTPGLDPRNELNDLTGAEWAAFTKSWFVHNPPPRSPKETLHPAKFPETMVAEFLEFFTKRHAEH